MRTILPPRRLLAGAAAVTLALAHMPPAGFAAGKDGPFVTGLKAQNAQHLGRTIALQEQNRPPGIERDWQQKLTRQSWRLSDGPISISVGLKKGGPPDGMVFQNPVVTLSVDGTKVLISEGTESFPDNPIFLVQIAEMDPGNPYPEVVFSTFTGGAHCCSDTRVLASSKDGANWREIEIGQFDGDLLKARDLDGDGRYEFAMRDNAFLYTFGCYACSTAPLHVLRLENGEPKDASYTPAFRDHHVRSLKNMVEAADDERDRNGFLAGYVAQKILLGEGAQAWDFMLKHYDRKSDWGLESCAVKEDEKGDCPPGRKVTLKFPEALERFLEENGYDLKK